MLKTGGPTITIITRKETPAPVSLEPSAAKASGSAPGLPAASPMSSKGTGAAFGITQPATTPGASSPLTIGNSLDMGLGLGFPPAPMFRYGIIEGQTEALSTETVLRLTCEASTVELTTDIFGNPLDMGRELRLFNRAQRRAMSARDGGCMWIGCDCPPSWTEAHHLLEWLYGGKTDIANGILLCRHHHLLLHNEHWEITLDGGHYWLRPPANLDPAQTPILLESKNRTGRAIGLTG